VNKPTKNDTERDEALFAAIRRGDIFAMARLTSEEWSACRALWATSPLRHLVLGFAIALTLRVFREAFNGPIAIDLLGLIALLWYGGKTILAIIRPSKN